MKKNVAVIGTTGLPSSYGGFETLAENLISIGNDIKFTVFCSSKGGGRKLNTYKGARLKYIPLNANSVQSIIYDFIGMLGSLHSDTMLILGVSGTVFFPILKLFYYGRIIVNIDGLEWKREKWSKIARSFLKLSEYIAVRLSNTVIADNTAIVEYIWKRYRKKAVYIAYGGDHIVKNTIIYRDYAIPERYAFTVCRIEPENNIDIILESFINNNLPIVVVGNWQSSPYGKMLFQKYFGKNGIYLLDPIYNQYKLDSIRSRSYIYIHGHSVGGTNPSLVEAMSFGLPICAFDVSYNRETTGNQCLYFSNSSGLLKILSDTDEVVLEMIGKHMKKIADERYKWDIIRSQYQALL